MVFEAQRDLRYLDKNFENIIRVILFVEVFACFSTNDPEHAQLLIITAILTWYSMVNNKISSQPKREHINDFIT